jgi:hypothetical protein
LASPKRQMVAGGDSARLRGEPRMPATCDSSRPINRSRFPAAGAAGADGGGKAVSCCCGGGGSAVGCGGGGKGAATGGVSTSPAAGGSRASAVPAGGGGLRGGGGGNGAAAMGWTRGFDGGDPGPNVSQPVSAKARPHTSNIALHCVP